MGITALKEITPPQQLTLLPITDLTDEQSQQRYFIDYEKGKNADKITLDTAKTTADYFQALIYIEGSKPNVPYGWSGAEQ